VTLLYTRGGWAAYEVLWKKLVLNNLIFSSATFEYFDHFFPPGGVPGVPQVL